MGFIGKSFKFVHTNYSKIGGNGLLFKVLYIASETILWIIY